MRKQLYRWITIMLIICQLFMGAATAFAEEVVSAKLRTASTVRDGMVRVWLKSMGYHNALDIKLTGAFAASGTQRVELPGGANIRVSMNTSTGELTLSYGSLQYNMGKSLTLQRRATDGQSGFTIAQAKKSGNLYPGDLRLVAKESNGNWQLHPVAHVYIEYYLQGVLPYEMGNSAPLEALKAQAVAARTFTINRMNTNNTLYDLTDTTSDQVYYGNSSSTDRCTQAINETRGIVLMVDNRFVATYYTSSNGGQTESVANAWGSKGYTESIVKDDPFDFQNPASTVKSAFVYKNNQHQAQPAKLRDLLNKRATEYLRTDATVKTITAIRLHTPMYPEPSRVYSKITFSVVAEANGRDYSFDLDFAAFSEVETLLGISINGGTGNELWTVMEESSAFRISARRHGHGIGMSQRGAMQMATLGYTYDQILGFYYNKSYRMQFTFSHTILPSVGDDSIITTEKPADITTSDAITATVTLPDKDQTVNVRAAASMDAAVKTTLPHGAQVIVLSNNGTWCEIRTGGTNGFIKKEFLVYNTDKEPTATPAPSVPETIGYAYVTTPSGTLNLRSMADSGSHVLDQIPRMTKLPIHANSDGWTQVTYKNQTGWVMTTFLTLAEDDKPDDDNVTGETATVTTISGSLNLRETNSGQARILAQIPRGTKIPVLEKQAAWTKTTYGGQTGWVMNSFLTFSGSSTPDDATPVQTRATVIGGSLNLRASNTTAARVLVQIPRDTVITVMEQKDGWARTSYGKHAGWVMTRYLSFLSQETTQPDASTPTPTPTVTPDGGIVQPPAGVTAVVIGGKLNLREKANTDAPVLIRIPEGAGVTVIERGSAWSQVQYGRYTGHVMTRYLSFDDAAAAETARVTTPSGSLNLREKDESGARILLQIPQGSMVTVLQKQSGWCLVRYQGTSGFVMTKFLSFSSSGAGSTGTQDPETATPTPTPVTSTPTAAPAAGDKAWVNVNGTLNMRRSADSESTVLAMLQNRAEVTVLSRGDTWTKIRAATLTGYVQTKYLDWTKPSAEPEGALRYVDTDGTLNLRSDSRSGANVILTIPDQSAVRLMEYKGAWSRVSYQGVTGYVQSVYLTGTVPAAPENPLEKPTGSPTETPPPTVAVYDTTLKDTERMMLAVVRDGLERVPVYRWCATNSAAEVMLEKGQAAVVTQIGDTWCKVQVDRSTSGYCLKTDLNIMSAE